jgi:catalase (peroxidase I)
MKSPSSGALFGFEYSCPSYVFKESAMEETAKCPYTGAKLADEGKYNRDWWPEQLNLKESTT